MTKHAVFGTLGAFALVLAVGLSLLPQTPIAAQVKYTPADIAQGKYLVEDVGLCLGCHGQNLEGRPLRPDSPPNAVADPKIAGLPMFANDADAIKFFETGLMPDGSTAKAPMRAFRFKPSDAVALTAYLRSLP